MRKLMLLVAVLAIVLLASAPALTQTEQPVGNTDLAPPTTTSNPVAAPSTPPAPECGWWDNPERGWGWDYWCYHPTQQYWVPVFFGVT
jgi:hypothetical protein